MQKGVPEIIDDALDLFTDEMTRDLYTRQAGTIKKLVRECKLNGGIPIKSLESVAQLTEFLVKGVKNGIACFVGPLKQLVAMHGQLFLREKSFEALEHTNSQLSAFAAVTQAMACGLPEITQEVALAIANFANQSHGSYSSNKQEMELPFQILAEGDAIKRIIIELQGALCVPANDKEALRNYAAKTLGPPSSRADSTVNTAREGGIDSNISTSRNNYKGDEKHSSRGAKSESNEDKTRDVEENKEKGVLEYNSGATAFSKSYTPITITLLETLRDLSFHQGCASLMLKEGVLPVLPVFFYHDYKSTIVQLAVEVLWNILEVHPMASTEFRKFDSSFQACTSLMSRLDECYRFRDKELRNELAAILCILARNQVNHVALAMNGCLRMALTQSTRLELGVRNPKGQTFGELDFELKQLLWSFVLDTLSSDVVLSLAIESNIAKAMRVHLDPNQASHPYLKILNPPQKVELSSRALYFCMRLLPRTPGLFLTLGYYRVLMGFVNWQVQKTASGEQHQEVTTRLVNLALRCLVKILAQVDTSKVELTVDDAELLLSVFSDDTTPSADRSNAISCLGLLAHHHPFNQRVLRKASGVRVLASSVMEIGERGLGSEVLLLHAAVDCVWRGVVGNPRNEAHWLRLNGMDVLLMALCTCAPEMRGMILGCLADLMLNPKAVPYFWEWRGPVQQSGKVMSSLVPYLPGGDEKLAKSNNALYEVQAKRESSKTSTPKQLDNSNAVAVEKSRPGDMAVALLLELWETHRPEEDVVTSVIDEINEQSGEKLAQHEKDLASAIFKSIKMNENGDFDYSLQYHGKTQTADRELVRKLLEEFKRLDTDGSQSLSATEIIPLCRQLGVNIEPRFIKALMQTIDIDGDGELDFTEILAFFLLREHRQRGDLDLLRRPKTPHVERPKTSDPITESDNDEEDIKGKKNETTVFDPHVREMVHSIVSLISISHQDLTKDQRSRLNVIAHFKKLQHGLAWTKMSEDIQRELAEEGLTPIEADLDWVHSQIENFQETILQLQAFSHDEEAALKTMEGGVVNHFLASVTTNIAEKGRQQLQINLAKPKSVKDRKAIKDKKMNMIKASLDARATLKRTLRCRDEDVEDLIRQTHEAKAAMKKKFHDTLSPRSKAAKEEEKKHKT